MELLWGDLHCHCGITYGFGSLSNALDRAAAHLDFCAVTGHAMWPDMYERNEETAFIVDFHNRGFQKLRDHWGEVRAAVQAANSPGLVTFQSYEMHSSHYGDHHILSPDDGLPLIDSPSPRALLEAVGCEAMTIAHHIGYTPGYRGIHWGDHDDDITPLIEVCSKHGCSMRAESPYPYYHDMGPLDPRNTVFEGLRRGNVFGFVGSTDHHAGFPGSYGDGKVGVWAEEKSREAIWQALRERRTYAVTGDRIRCEFAVDGHPMGSLFHTGNPTREITCRVQGGSALDQVVVYKNLEPLHILTWDHLPRPAASGRFKIRVEMGWGNNADEPFPWEGNVRLKGGVLLDVEPCFRGRSILSPTGAKGSEAEEVNAMKDRILERTPDRVAWQCETLRNISTLHPQTCAVILEVEGNPDTALEFSINGMMENRTLKELVQAGFSRHVKPHHAQAVLVHTAVPEALYTAELHIPDPSPGGTQDCYHLEVRQDNGCWAFVSPVFVRC